MSHTRKVLQGSASNIAKVVLGTLIALVLPPLLVHRMEPAEYGAWVLILQIAAYVNLLDVGLQTGIGKFVAQYDAAGDSRSSSRILSTSLAILSVSALIGALAIALIAWRVPQLFNQMPAALVGDLREGILLVGWSVALALPFSSYLATFTGLQKYGFPTLLAMGSRLLSAAALIALILRGGTLVQLAMVIAGFNVATALGQYVGWKTYIGKRVVFSIRAIGRDCAVQLAKYCSTISVWTVALLLVSGLDMVIVGHFDYKNTGYYGIAVSPTNFMVVIISGLFGPLVPALSALQTERTPRQLGELVIRTTRYCALLTCLVGLPLLVGAYPLLRLWVGSTYATQSVRYLQVLVVGNAIRQLGYPYSLTVLATGKQHLATLAGVIEALVNVTLSIYLVQHIGAIGVAIGTVVGAFVSVGLHILLSIRLTSATVAISRRRFIWDGLLRPLLCVVPTVLLFPEWRHFELIPSALYWLAAWVVSTISIAWLTGLTHGDRESLKQMFSRSFHLAKASV